MAYIEIDLATPRMGKYLANSKSKYLLTESIAKGGINTGKWPTKYVNGFEVFDILPIGNRYVGPINNKQVYKGLGMSYSDIAKQDMSQLESLWMYLKPKPFDRHLITKQDVIGYLNNGSAIDEEFTIDLVFTKKIATQNVRAHTDLTNDQIIAMIEGGYESIYPRTTVENSTRVVNGVEEQVSHTVYSSLVEYELPSKAIYVDENGDSTPEEDNTASSVTFASLMDTANVLYDSTTKIISKSVVPAYAENWLGGPPSITSYTIMATIEYKFKRKIDAGHADADALVSLILEKANTAVDATNTMVRQIMTMVRHYEPIVVSSDLYTYETVIQPLGDPETGITTGYVKVGNPPVYENGVLVTPGTGIRGLKKKEFALIFPSLIETDYIQYRPKKKWYSALLTIIVIIVVFIITRNIALAMKVGAGLSGVAYYYAVMTFYSIALTVSVLAVSLLARAFASRSSTLSYAFGDSIGILSTVSMIAGWISTVLGIGVMINSIREAIGRKLQEKAMDTLTQEAINDMAFEVVEDITTETALDAFREASIAEIISATIEMAVDAVQEMAINTFDNVVSAFNGSLFSNTSTMEIISRVGQTVQLFTSITTKADHSTPDPQTADEHVPDNIDAAEIMFRYFESTEMCDPITTEDMCHGMLQGTIERKFDQHYKNTFP